MEKIDKDSNRYSKSKIYMISDKSYTERYIGSTVETLSARMAKHRNHYRHYKNGLERPISAFLIFDKFGIENCVIELIQEVPCETKEQLRRIEGEYIRKMECVNKRIECRTDKEYYNDNRIKILSSQKRI